MHVQNILAHKRNTTVTVNGNTYWIGPGGFIASKDAPRIPVSIPDVDAEKMCQGKAWKALDWDPADPANALRYVTLEAAKPLSPAALGRPVREISKVMAVPPVKPVLKGPEDDIPEGPALDALLKADLEQDEKSRHLGTEAPPALPVMEDAEISPPVTLSAPPPPPPPVYEKSVPAATGPADWVIPGDGDWPEPVEAMPLEYLRSMADAYEVSYTARVKKETLVKRITTAMFSED